MKKLAKLYASGTLSKVDPTEKKSVLSAISFLRNLEELDLRLNALQTNMLPDLTNQTNLKILRIDNNDIFIGTNCIDLGSEAERRSCCPFDTKFRNSDENFRLTLDSFSDGVNDFARDICKMECVPFDGSALQCRPPNSCDLGD